MQTIRVSRRRARVKGLRRMVVADVFGVALHCLVAQAIVITATAWAEDLQSDIACNFEVKREYTPVSEIAPFMDAIVVASDPDFYNRTLEETTRMYEYYKA